MCKMTIGCRHGNERQNLRTGWYLRMVAIDRSAISSTQQEVLGL